MGRRRYRTYVREVVVSPEEQERRRLRALEANYEIALRILPELYSKLNSGDVEAIRNSIRYHESAKRKWLEVLEADRIKKEAEDKRKAVENRKAAIIAAFFNKTRDLADELKKQLAGQIEVLPFCPYCGQPYGLEPHADHIYPVSRGGLSTLDNLVLVCCGCNLKKSKKTLREFILAFGMDRALIERNLGTLGKTF